MPKTNKIARYVKVPPALERQVKTNGHAKPSGLYLLELRSRHAAAQSSLPKRKLIITIEPRDSADGSSKEIKITHTQVRSA